MVVWFVCKGVEKRLPVYSSLGRLCKYIGRRVTSGSSSIDKKVYGPVLPVAKRLRGR